VPATSQGGGEEGRNGQKTPSVGNQHSLLSPRRERGATRTDIEGAGVGVGKQVGFMEALIVMRGGE